MLLLRVDETKKGRDFELLREKMKSSICVLVRPERSKSVGRRSL